MIIDQHQRVHDYLRISLTDKCNFRCTYCMPEDKADFLPDQKNMTAPEIIRIAKIFVEMGVRKIRLTGGEPLVRKDAAEIIRNLAQLPVELTLTSNGVLIHEFIPLMKQVGIRSVNISLDTLNPQLFQQLSRRNAFEQVWNNIQLLIGNGIHVKLNMVAIKGVNDHEINDFIGITKDQPLHVRFIELMPFTGNHWNKDQVLTTHEILSRIDQEYAYVKIQDEKHDTAKKFQPLLHQGTFAIISTMTAPFCAGCNRIRLTADGKIKNCLFSSGEMDLLTALRRGEDISALIVKEMHGKHKERGGQFPEGYEETQATEIINRSMVSIGG